MCGLTAAIIASTAFSAFSAYATGQQQKAAANYNAQVAENAAASQRSLGLEAEWRKRQEVRRALGEQEAAEGISGFVSSTGTPLLLAQQSAQEGEYDALMTRYGYMQKADQLSAEARGYRYQAAGANTLSFTGAGASLLQGATDYYRLK